MATPAYASCIEHIEKCIDDKIDDLAGKLIHTAIHDLEKDVIDPIKTDVTKVDKKVVSIENSLGKDIGTVVHDIEKDVVEIAHDAESLEQTVVNDIKTDIKDVKDDVNVIKDDIQKIKDVVKSVEKIEKKVVNFTEELFKFIWDDFVENFKYVIYGLVAIVAGYIVIRIIQFAIWLKAYLRQDSLEHLSKKRVAQNEEIIELLKKLTK